MDQEGADKIYLVGSEDYTENTSSEKPVSLLSPLPGKKQKKPRIEAL